MAFRTNKVPAIEERTVSGSSVSFNSAFALPLKACKVSFSATQAGSGEPSPSNPRAISGVSAIGLNANSTPVSVSLGDTRYGGELDVLTGILTVTHQLFTFDGSEKWLRRQEGFSAFQLFKSQNPKIENLKTYYNGIFSIGNMAELVNTAAVTANQYFISNSLFICDLGIMDIDDFKTALSNQNLEIASELSEPITIQLSANELSSIIGNNTFSTDTGTLEITFADLQEKSASGSVASFNTALAMPLVSGEFSIQAYQEGSGDPSPVNVRNIVPRREVDIKHTGVNTWSENWELGDLDNTTGATTPSGQYIRSKDYEIIKPSTKYCVSLSQISVFYYDVNKTFIERVLTSYNNQAITSPSNACYFKIKRYGTTYGNDISLNYPSTQTGYIAYTGNTYTIQLGQDVYGGVYDSVSGEATVDKAYDVLDGSENWGETAAAYYIEKPDMKMGSAMMNGLCNIAPTVSGLNQAGIVFGSNNNRIYFSKLWAQANNINSLEELKTLLSNTNAQISYPLATPTETQLTPTQIETLIGNNTIFADTGDVDLTYKDLDIAKRGNFREVFKLPS